MEAGGRVSKIGSWVWAAKWSGSGGSFRSYTGWYRPRDYLVASSMSHVLPTCAKLVSRCIPTRILVRFG